MRVLIAIGCDSYNNPPLQPLSGAENDAATIFGHLVTDAGNGLRAFARRGVSEAPRDGSPVPEPGLTLAAAPGAFGERAVIT